MADTWPIVPDPWANTPITYNPKTNSDINYNPATGKIITAITTSPADNGPGGTTTKAVNAAQLKTYNWNLPPHKWSLPVQASDDPLVLNSSKYTLGSNEVYRRGRIYWYSRVNTKKINSSAYNTGTGAFADDPRYGFQFLWNPQSFSTNVSVNMDTTPSFADAFAGVVGAFPSGESLSVAFTLNRVNDFASIRNLPPRSVTGGTSQTSYAKNASKFVEYYKTGFTIQSNLLIPKIIELQKYGTIADLEYLYKAINGPGWKNQATGKSTSDIGFLKPTLLRIDIGPLSYLGYVTNISVNHVMFSRDMVPVQTDVALQFNLMATASLSSQTLNVKKGD